MHVHYTSWRYQTSMNGRWRACALAASLFTLAAQAAGLPNRITTSDGAEMVLIPAGPFLMGSQNGAPEESPPHGRHLSAFYIDCTEVTVAQYTAFLAATANAPPPGCTSNPPPSIRDLPITNIQWTDAMRYALWAGKRLPTEAEWEKAARGSDGRRYPWGEVDATEHRNLDTGKLRPVGSYPQGRSPYGCLDMSGNAWEWTADWFTAYPGAMSPSAHFGKHYKVIRGGAGEYLYATANSGTASQRARLVPYGAHDFVGFRCVKDPPDQPAPYNPDEFLREVEATIARKLPPPRPLACEQEFAARNNEGSVPVDISGAPGQVGLVTMGFPLPRGRLHDLGRMAVLGADGRARPHAAEPLALWPDGSPRWVLLRFPGRSGETVKVHMEYPRSAHVAPLPSLTLHTNDGAILIDAGPICIELDQQTPIRAVRKGDQNLCGALQASLTLLENGRPLSLRAGAADHFKIESVSALHADLRWCGKFMEAEGRAGPMTYDLRLRAEAGSSQVRFWLTVLHNAARQQPWEELKPQVALADWQVAFSLCQPANQWTVGCDGSAMALTNISCVALNQLDDLQFCLAADGRQLAKGTRASGWLTADSPQGSVTLGIRHFWQNHPIGLLGDRRVIGARFWTCAAPFTWEGGLGKTHEFVLDFARCSPAAPALSPLLGIVSPAWACGTEAAGALLPRTVEALQQLGYWEGWREESMYRWVNAMPTGLRDFGDAYMGGPHKGKNAYSNLEYDVPWNFLQQFLRTAKRWYFDAAGPMVRHQADVDTENVSGFAWKHSPLHTTTQAEFGHVFLRGMLLHHLLTGDPRDREIAERLGDWIVESLERGQGVGNERQIGWSLWALAALHETTGKCRYLESARALCDRLAGQQSPNGKFNLRWDNRIAFFNGIALNGMLAVNELAPDSTVEQAMLRLANRTFGMYPEYACRTLNGFCWAFEKSRDPRFLNQIELTWLASLDYLMSRNCTTAETHAWRFPAFALRYSLFPTRLDATTPVLNADHWRAFRFKAPSVTLYVRPQDRSPRSVVLIREGLASGSVRLFDARGDLVKRLELNDTGRLIEGGSVQLPNRRSWSRLLLVSSDASAWQVQHDQSTAIVVADPRGQMLPFLLPRAVGAASPGAAELVMRFEARGEGFHSATLFDPRGVPVRRVQRFIDIHDPGRYELELKAPVAGSPVGWSLELNDVTVVSFTGWLPWWAADPGDWFNPEWDGSALEAPVNANGQ